MVLSKASTTAFACAAAVVAGTGYLAYYQPQLLTRLLWPTGTPEAAAEAPEVVELPTTPYEGQKPGTSGLRKKVVEFQKENYLANFVQATFDALPDGEATGTLVVSGDGRYFSKEAIQLIIEMALANGVQRVWVGLGGLMATPVVSAVIRERKTPEGGKPFGAFILTASHNPGGPKADFGIKYNCANGGPAPEGLTSKIFENTKVISTYKTTKNVPTVDLGKVGTTKIGESFEVEVFDASDVYTDLFKSIFDFAAIRGLVKRSDFSMVYDGMHGVAGPFATRLFVKELGAPKSSLMNCIPKEDFGGGHPDPNLTYAEELVAKMAYGKPAQAAVAPDFGAASDGDADRNMIMGRNFFVTPSDSVAIIAANGQAIPYFKEGLKGVARSMPTSGALDRVAEACGIQAFEVPTGWKFFGNLMDAGKCSICGEESFGTGSDHVREKDGLWAVLAWLSILASKNRDTPVGQLVGVEDIVREHWAKYGRNYYTRYDYEECASEGAKSLMAHLQEHQKDLPTLNTKISEILAAAKTSEPREVTTADVFEYTDPVDKSVSKNQGIRFLFADGSRIVFRLSGTGSVGATIRMYIEQYSKEETVGEPKEMLEPLVKIGVELSRIEHFTGKKAPDVIT
eukprot:scaffold1042_cov401-Prasinococcus_capsulatus_cf.AAC.24